MRVKNQLYDSQNLSGDESANYIKQKMAFNSFQDQKPDAPIPFQPLIHL